MARIEPMESDAPTDRPITDTAPPIGGPDLCGEYPVWRASRGPVEVRFVGRSRDAAAPHDPPRGELLRETCERSLPVAELRQVHSANVLAATAGMVGDADALWTGRPGLALSVVTADCVPVVLAGPTAAGEWRISVAHAGWRGIVAGVVPRAIEALDVPPSRLVVWIGPAIGACCYEVDHEVARLVAAAAGGSSVVPPLDRTRRKPHLDLVAAVRHQLIMAGAPAPRIVLRCTRCDERTLWSYRREGKGAGRNHVFVWLEDGPARHPEHRGETVCD